MSRVSAVSIYYLEFVLDQYPGKELSIMILKYTLRLDILKIILDDWMKEKLEDGFSRASHVRRSKVSLPAHIEAHARMHVCSHHTKTRDVLPDRDYMSDEAVQEGVDILKVLYFNFGTKIPILSKFKASCPE